MTKKIKAARKDQSQVDDKDAVRKTEAADELDIAALKEVSGGSIIPTSPARPYRSAASGSTAVGSANGPGAAIDAVIGAKNAAVDAVIDMINANAATQKKVLGG